MIWTEQQLILQLKITKAIKEIPSQVISKPVGRFLR
jgi:hypothetical protein